MGQIQVGRTLLHKSIEFSGKCGCAVYVKREDKEPFGTFKDRRCAALRDACSPDTHFVHITSANSGYSMGMQAEGRVVNVVDKGIPKGMRKKLESCSIVHEMDLSQGIINDDTLRALAIRLVRERTGRTIDEKNVVNIESHGLVDGYRKIIKEIAEDGVKPTYIFCPVGGGELATELAAQAAETWGDGAPKIIGVTIRENVLTRAKDFLKRSRKSIADKLVSRYSKFKPLVKKLVSEDRLELMAVSDGAIAKEYRYLNDVLGIPAEPSAAAAFCGAEKYDLKPTDTVVIINTGKGIYDQFAVEKAWMRRLARGLKYAAVAAVGATLVAAAGWFWLRGQEKIAYDALCREAMLYADKSRDGVLNEDEAAKIYLNVLDIHINNVHRDYKDIGIWSLTPVQLEVYVRYERLTTNANLASDGGIWGHMMGDLRTSYENGTFRCQTLHPNVPFLYKKQPDLAYGDMYSVR